MGEAVMATNKQIADAFRAAKILIKNGSEEFICIALFEVDKPGSEAAIKVIEARLGMSLTLEGWLVSRGHATRDEVLYSRDAALKMQITRLAWLDSLIAEFDAKARKERA